MCTIFPNSSVFLNVLSSKAVSKVGGINEVFDIAGRWDRLNIIE